MARLVAFLWIYTCIFIVKVNSKCGFPPSEGPLYRIMLDNCGPEPKVNPPIEAPHVVAPTIHQPLKKLPHPPIPAPRVLSHRIVHYKTILRPQVYQRVITVPKVYKFLKKTVAPVIEHIPYQAKPILHELAAPPVHIPGSHLQLLHSPPNPPPPAPHPPQHPATVCHPPQHPAPVCHPPPNPTLTHHPTQNTAPANCQTPAIPDLPLPNIKFVPPDHPKLSSCFKRPYRNPGLPPSLC